jgi:ATP-dependent DNA ligase
MLKVKHARTADCVVAGFRWHKNGPGTLVGSLLLGQDAGGPGDGDDGDAAQRKPGMTSRWNRGKDLFWEPLRVERVCEVAYDHLQGDRFRHATHFLRWRPDKAPRDCRYDQLEATPPVELERIFGAR